MQTEFLKVEGLGKTYPGASEPVFDGVNFDKCFSSSKAFVQR